MLSSTRSKVDVFPLSSFILEEAEEWDASTGLAGSPGPSAQQPQQQQLKDYSAQARLLRLKRRYDREGLIRSVEGVVLAHVHNHPHVLLFRQKAKALGVLPLSGQFSTGGPQAAFRLPGGKCRRDEGEIEAMYRKLGRHLLGEPKAPYATTKTDRISVTVGNTPGGVGSAGVDGVGDAANEDNSSRQQHASRAPLVFRVGEVLAQWHRPSFDRLMFPYIPAHVTQAKETRTLFLIHVMVDDAAALRLVAGGGGSSNMEIVAVPLFELFDNAAKYGAVASSIPHIVSRLHINYC